MKSIKVNHSAETSGTSANEKQYNVTTLTVLDFTSYNTFIYKWDYSHKQIIEDTNDTFIADFLNKEGHDVSNCQWMVCKSIVTLYKKQLT